MIRLGLCYLNYHKSGRLAKTLLLAGAEKD
jgi:hypothetical protein